MATGDISGVGDVREMGDGMTICGEGGMVYEGRRRTG
jgi:hypothetical protein